MKKFLFLGLMLFALLICVNGDLLGQCPMCRMSAESNLQSGGTAGRGLNAGILYMLSMPYLLVASIGYIWWRNRKKETDDQRHLWN